MSEKYRDNTQAADSQDKVYNSQSPRFQQNEKKKKSKTGTKIRVTNVQYCSYTWWLDSVSTSYYNHLRESLINVKELEIPLNIEAAEKDRVLKGTHIGDLKAYSIVNGRKADLSLCHVLYSEDFKLNWISIRALQSDISTIVRKILSRNLFTSG